MVVVAAEPGQCQQILRQRIKREDALNAAQARIGNLGTIGEFHNHAHVSAPAEGYDHELTGNRCEIARTVIEKRL